MNERPDSTAIEAAMLSLVEERGPGRTLCPSEVARALVGGHPDHWGPMMQPVREAAIRLMKQGRITILRKGRAVDPDGFKGVYRIGSPARNAAPPK